MPLSGKPPRKSAASIPRSSCSFAPPSPIPPPSPPSPFSVVFFSISISFAATRTSLLAPPPQPRSTTCAAMRKNTRARTCILTVYLRTLFIYTSSSFLLARTTHTHSLSLFHAYTSFFISSSSTHTHTHTASLHNYTHTHYHSITRENRSAIDLSVHLSVAGF